MTKKDYILIAKSIKLINFDQQTLDSVVGKVAESIAISLKADNPKFDYSRFIKMSIEPR